MTIKYFVTRKVEFQCNVTLLGHYIYFLVELFEWLILMMLLVLLFSIWNSIVHGLSCRVIFCPIKIIKIIKRRRRRRSSNKTRNDNNISRTEKRRKSCTSKWCYVRWWSWTNVRKWRRMAVKEESAKDMYELNDRVSHVKIFTSSLIFDAHLNPIISQ